MLVLTRKVGESIMIGDNIHVTVVAIKGDNIRLAINAPPQIKIYRSELYDAIVAENKQSAVSIGSREMDILKKIQKE